MITIYRIEHPKTGRGPYTSFEYQNKKLYNFLMEHSFSPDHPTPWLEPGLRSILTTHFEDKAMRHHVCAFKTLEKLYEWFEPECLTELWACGFVLRELRIPVRAVLGTGGQVLVHKKYL